MILVDTLRAKNLSAYGYSRKTSPTLDALAAEGTICDKNYAQGPITITSVPSLMTGRYFPVFSDSDTNWRLLAKQPPPGEIQLPDLLRANGYLTAAIMTHAYWQRGSRLYDAFDEFRQVPQAVRDDGKFQFGECLPAALEWLSQPHDKPWFLYLHLMDVHCPRIIRDGSDMWIDKNNPRAAEFVEAEMARDSSEFNRAPYGAEDQAFIAGLYDGAIHHTDRMIGKVLEALKAQGLAENTVVLVCADHGEMLVEDGKTYGHYSDSSVDEIFQTPLIFAGPGVPKGRHIQGLTENVDIVPTLVDLLGLHSAGEYDGRSLLPAMRGEDTGREFWFAKLRADYGVTPDLMLSTDKIKWIYTDAPLNRVAYRMPDSLASRSLSEVADPAQAFPPSAIDTLEAKREAYDALPLGSVPCFYIPLPPPAHGQENAYVSLGDGDENWTDNKWTFNEDQLISCGWREDAPPVRIEMDVAPGRYNVDVALVMADNEGHPASACLVKARDDKEFRRIVTSGDQEEYRSLRFVPIGLYDATDGRFEITLDDDRNGYWSAVNGLRFTSEDFSNPTSMEQSEDAREALRAVGYLKN
jgi:arylsulfatase A-like enzyme